MENDLRIIAHRLGARFRVHPPTQFDHSFIFVIEGVIHTLVVYDTFAHLATHAEPNETLRRMVGAVLDVPVIPFYVNVGVSA